MVFLLFLVVGSLILIILILLSRIHVSLTFEYSAEVQQVVSCVYFYRIRLYKRTVDLSIDSSVKWDELFNEGMTIGFKKVYQEIKKIVKTSKRILTTLIRRSKCNELTWRTCIGTGEAATTGTIIGSMWALKGAFVGLISKQCQMNCKPAITITPYFQQQYLSMEFTCMFSIKLGQTIYIILKEMKSS